MSRQTALARARAAAEVGMVDTCEIVRLSEGILNQQTGQRTTVSTIVYTGPCRIQATIPGGARLTDEGESSRSMLARQLQLPVEGSEDLQVADQARILTCPNDSDLVGRVFRLKVLAGKTDASARRLGVEEWT